MAETTLYIVRHGETEAKRDGFVCGVTDSPLTEKGKQEIKRLSGFFSLIPLDAAYVSPLKRARQSAEAILGDTPLPFFVESDLREIDYGVWDGKPSKEYAEAKKEYFSKNPEADGLSVGVGGAESYRDAASRFEGVLSKVSRENPGKQLLIANHSGNMRALILCGSIAFPGEVVERAKKGDLGFGDILVLRGDKDTLDFVEYKSFL